MTPTATPTAPTAPTTRMLPELGGEQVPVVASVPKTSATFGYGWNGFTFYTLRTGQWVAVANQAPSAACPVCGVALAGPSDTTTTVAHVGCAAAQRAQAATPGSWFER